MYKYRRLFPMTEQQYLDESCDTIEWALRLAEIYGDRPWLTARRPEGGGPDGVTRVT